MSDLIKKVKIKKQDDTYTDYIPIGAEAKNVDCSDGESVQEKIEKTIYKNDIIDNLESDDNEKALSAKQGKVLGNSYLINEITYEEFYNANSKSNVHIIHVPHTDSDGNVIKIKHGYANDVIDTGPEKASDFSNRHKTTLTINASVGAVQSQVTEQIHLWDLLGLYIHEGEIIKDNRNLLTENFLKNRYILGITATGLLKSYIGDTSAQTILNDGVIETCQAFIPILVNGENNRQNLINAGTTYWGTTTFVETEDTIPDYNKIYYILNNGQYTGVMNLNAFSRDITYYEEVWEQWTHYARQIICQDSSSLDYYIITADGKGQISNLGLSLNDYVTIAKKYGCDFAFVLDGGGSTTTIYKNIMINNKMDDPTNYSTLNDGIGYTERKVSDFLYFNKNVVTENDKNINFLLNEVNKLNNKINDLILKEDNKFMSYTDFYEKAAQQHLFRFNKWDNNKKDFVESMDIYFDNSTSYPSGINVRDVINNKNVLRLHNNINDGIRFLDKNLALWFNTIPSLTDSTLDLDNLTPDATALELNSNLNLSNQPFTYDESHIYWLFQWGGGYYKFQVAMAIKSLPIIKIRTKVDGSWQPWREIAVTGI